MLLLMRKDLLQGWRTFRFPGLLLTLIFFALLEPLTARYMPELLALFAQDLGELIELLPKMGPPEALISYFGDTTQIGALVLIGIAMGAVALERDRGIAAWVLTRPVSRERYLWSKYLTHAVALIAALAAGGALVIAYTGSLLGPVPLREALWALLFSGLFLNLILAVTVSASAFFRSQLAAGGAGIAFLFLVWLPALIPGNPAVLRYFPHVLAGSPAGLLLGVQEWRHFLPAALITTALALGLIACSALWFRKTEL